MNLAYTPCFRCFKFITGTPFLFLKTVLKRKDYEKCELPELMLRNGAKALITLFSSASFWVKVIFWGF